MQFENFIVVDGKALLHKAVFYFFSLEENIVLHAILLSLFYYKIFELHTVVNVFYYRFVISHKVLLFFPV